MSDIKRALDNKQSRPTRALGEPKFPIVDRRRSEKRRVVSSAASNARRSACIVAQLTIMSPIDRADEIEFKRAPPALQFMLGARMSSPGPTGELPPIAATRREHRIDRRSLATYLALSVARRESFSRCTSMWILVRRLSAAFVVVMKRRRIEAERLRRRQPDTPAEARAYAPMSK